VFIAFITVILITTIVAANTSTLIIMVMMTLLNTRHVVIVVPAMLYKVDALAAGIIVTTMSTPVYGMARWYAQINRLALNINPFNDSRLTINEARLRIRIITDINPAKKSRLIDTDRYADIGRIGLEAKTRRNYRH